MKKIIIHSLKFFTLPPFEKRLKEGEQGSTIFGLDELDKKA